MLKDIELNYLTNLAQNNYSELSKLDGFEKLVCAIKVIEKHNRSLIWRITEYIYLVLVILFRKKIFRNISIGIYQIKISHLFEFLNLEYYLYGEFIKPKLFDFKVIYMLYQLSNQSEVVDWYIKSNVSCDWENLDFEDVKQIAYLYSGCKRFERGLNYFIVLSYLYFGEQTFNGVDGGLGLRYCDKQ